jgi:hypothetical protein
MNTKNKAVYTMIGGLLIKNVPNWANKVKILSNGAVFALSENKQCQILDSNDSFALGNHDKYGFVVFDVPPLAPCFEVGSALGFDSFGVDGCISGVNCGGPIESGKTYVVGEQELPHEAIQALGRVKRVQEKDETSVNILTLSFESGSKLSDVINIVESEISNSGCNVTDNISSMSINEFRKHISDIVKDNIYTVSQKIATHVYNEEYNSSDVTLWMNELTKLESLMRKITSGGDIRLSVIS